MSHRPHLLVNTTRRAYIWGDPARATLPHLATDKYSPVSSLLYLLGTEWDGDRIALLGPVQSQADMREAAWQELGRDGSYATITRHDAGMTDATHHAATALAEGLAAAEQSASHQARSPRMIVNYDLRQRLDPAELGDGASLGRIANGASTGIPGGSQTALTLLLAGSSRGRVSRGDFPTNSELVGSWAGCRLGVVSVTSPEVARGTEPITGDVATVMEQAHLGSYVLNALGEVSRTWGYQEGREKYLRRFKRRRMLPRRHG